MLYPLFLEPFFKECVWGGENLKRKLNKNINNPNVGESFEVSCYKNFLCKIKNGIFKNTSLKSLIDLYPSEILGKNINSSFFPLIVKFLDATDKLSIQVHPNDKYAFEKSYSLGKNELWYVIYADNNSKIVLGLKDEVSKTDLLSSLKENNIETLLNIENVEIGDSIFIPSGTVHALLENVIVLEIQQSSDLTYRLYDWNRLEKGKPRKLHIEDALNVIDFSSKGKIIRANEYVHKNFYNIITTKDFVVDYISINESIIDNTKYKCFHIYTCIDGNGRILYGNQSEEISKGNTFLIPACVNEYEIRGNLKLLKTYL